MNYDVTDDYNSTVFVISGDEAKNQLAKPNFREISAKEFSLKFLWFAGIFLIRYSG